SGLREALGVGPDCPLTLAADRLPALEPPVDRAQVLAAALARRGEVIQAATAVQVTCLEIDAQESSHHRQLNTFAAGSDIHVSPDDLINAGVLASQLRGQANQAYYQVLQALAALERVTAGGFHAGFEAAAPAADNNARETNGAKGKDVNGKEGPNGM